MPALRGGFAPYQAGVLFTDLGPSVLLIFFAVAALLSARLIAGPEALPLSICAFALVATLLPRVPERNLASAQRERCRLFKLWEPRPPRPDSDLSAGNHLAERCLTGAALRSYKKSIGSASGEQKP